MESLSSRRAVARRALTPVVSHPSALVARLIDRDTDARPSTSWVRHAVIGVMLALLGLVVASSLMLSTTTQSTDTAINPRLVSNGPDITVAVPEQTQTAADSSTPGSVTDSVTEPDTGTLDVYDRRARSSSRQSVRDQLAKVAAQQQAAARAKGLSQAGADARDTAATEAEDQREDDVAQESQAAKVEQARLVEVKRKAEEAARLAAIKAEQEKKAGATGGVGDEDDPAAGPGAAPQDTETYAGPIPTGGGAVSPIAPGSYGLSARWGQVGLWARYHTGLDLGAPIGTPVRAAVTGVVVSDRAGGWAGNHVSIRAADGSSTLYAHMSAATVSPGQLVQAGTVIGHVGMTGRTFGPHLHFEYYPPGATPGDVYSSRDPWAWMYAHGVHL